MLRDYLNQTCTLCRAKGTDVRGQSVYGEPLSVPCRLQKKYKLVRKTDGETVPAEHVCYLVNKVSVGDTINGCIVHTVDSWVGLDGDIIGYKAVM